MKWSEHAAVGMGGLSTGMCDVSIQLCLRPQFSLRHSTICALCTALLRDNCFTYGWVDCWLRTLKLSGEDDVIIEKNLFFSRDVCAQA